MYISPTHHEIQSNNSSLLAVYMATNVLGVNLHLSSKKHPDITLRLGRRSSPQGLNGLWSNVRRNLYVFNVLATMLALDAKGLQNYRALKKRRYPITNCNVFLKNKAKAKQSAQKAPARPRYSTNAKRDNANGPWHESMLHNRG